jgi:hypothetical protein
VDRHEDGVDTADDERTMSSSPPWSRWPLTAVLGVIAALASVPFAAATMVSELRIERAVGQTSAIAALLRRSGSTTHTGAHLLIGSGDLPRFDSASEWLAGPSAPLGGALRTDDTPPPSTDPWRNSYLVNVGARGTVWVLSAGPNGVVDTPFENAAIVGDDIGASVNR